MSWIEERQVGGAMVVKIVAVIGGAFVGLVVGSVIRGLPVLGKYFRILDRLFGTWR
jgi:hypothetical protein